MNFYIINSSLHIMLYMAQYKYVLYVILIYLWIFLIAYMAQHAVMTGILIVHLL